jgi:putative tricarboxylic transport membrane protein
MTKGLLSGALGVWISCIGYNQTYGVERYVFSPVLASGVSLVGALIGLFAIPEVLKLMSASREPGGGVMYALEPRKVVASMRELTKHWWTLSMGSIVGCIVGIIPGAGGQVAGLLSYDRGRKYSPFRKTYGTGERDGVIASESANNATAGPALAPLLTLGVPGSPTAAVLMGGLLINGLFPGPGLFEKSGHITWVFIDGLLVAQVLMVAFGLYLARISSRIAQIPKRFMAAAVLILAVYGTYSIRNSFDDVLTMMGIGVLMFFLEKVGLTAGPLVLGIILGPIAEVNWEQGKLIADATGGVLPYFFTGFLNWILIGLCCISIIYSIISAVQTRKKRTPSKQDSLSST